MEGSGSARDCTLAEPLVLQIAARADSDCAFLDFPDSGGKRSHGSLLKGIVELALKTLRNPLMCLAISHALERKQERVLGKTEFELGVDTLKRCFLFNESIGSLMS